MMIDHIDQGDDQQLVEEVEEGRASLDFYQALVDINKEVDDEYIVEWAPSVKMNRSRNSRVLLTKDDAESLEAVVQKMKC